MSGILSRLSPDQVMIVTVFSEPELGTGTWLPVWKGTVKDVRRAVRGGFEAGNPSLPVVDPVTSEILYLMLAQIAVIRVTTIERMEAAAGQAGVSEEPEEG